MRLFGLFGLYPNKSNNPNKLRNLDKISKVNMEHQEKPTQRKSGRPPLVTDDEVIKLGIQIESEREYVSGNSIKRRLVAQGFDGGGNSNRYDEIWKNHLESRNKSESSTSNQTSVYVPDDVTQAIDTVKKSFEDIIASLVKTAIESSNKIHIRQTQEADIRANDAGIRCSKIENEAEEAINASQRVIDDLRKEIEEISKEITNIRELNSELLFSNKSKSDELLEYKNSTKACEIKIIHLEIELNESKRVLASTQDNFKKVIEVNSTLRDESLVLKTKYQAVVEQIEKMEKGRLSVNRKSLAGKQASAPHAP